MMGCSRKDGSCSTGVCELLHAFSKAEASHRPRVYFTYLT